MPCSFIDISNIQSEVYSIAKRKQRELQARSYELELVPPVSDRQTMYQGSEDDALAMSVRKVVFRPEETTENFLSSIKKGQQSVSSSFVSCLEPADSSLKHQQNKLESEEYALIAQLRQ